MRFTKVTGVFLKFDTGQRIETGVTYASQDLRLDENVIVARTFGHAKLIETHFKLQGDARLDFVATSDDASIPPITGRFFNHDYEECTFAAELPQQGVTIAGVLSKLSATEALSTKTVTTVSSGKLNGVLQERIEYISEDQFRELTNKT